VTRIFALPVYSALPTQMARITRIALSCLLVASCAAGARPLHFPARGTPAATTVESDDTLLAKGYVCLGPLEVTVEKERCRGPADRPGPCLPTDPTTESTGLLLVKAGDQGGDLVRLARHREAAERALVDAQRNPVMSAGESFLLAQVHALLAIEQRRGRIDLVRAPHAEVLGPERRKVLDVLEAAADPDHGRRAHGEMEVGCLPLRKLREQLVD